MGRYTGKKCRLISMFVLTAGYFFVELIVGYVTNSMSLVADSFHMLSDVIALIVAYLSVKMSPKKWAKNTFGWARAEVLGALVNAVFLVALCFSIFVEACKRFIEVEKIHQPELVLIVGSVGLVVNIVGLGLFHDYSKKRVPGNLHTKTSVTPDALEQIHERRTGKAFNSDAGMSADESNESGKSGGWFTEKVTSSEHGNPLQAVANDDINENDENFKSPPSELIEKKKKKKHGRGGGHSHSHYQDGSQMNMRGIFLHVLADALGSVVVVISALVIWKTDWDSKFYLDPALSLVLVVLILKSVWPLLLESALILLQTVPTHIQVDAIQRRLLDKVDGVLAVHEFHVWQLTGDRIIASAHIRVRNLSEYMKLAEKVKEFFHNEGIHSTTIQPEFLEINEMPKGTSQNSRDTKKNGACVLDCPKTEDQTTCVRSTCCGPQVPEPSSPNEMPYLCRQRCGSAASFGRMQEIHSEMESGHLLSTNGNPSRKNGSQSSYPKLSNKESRV